jgi:hypothetical protein
VPDPQQTELRDHRLGNNRKTCSDESWGSTSEIVDGGRVGALKLRNLSGEIAGTALPAKRS